MIDRCIFYYLFLFWAVLGLHCCMGFPLDVASRGYSLVMVCWLLIAVASLVVEHRLNNCAAEAQQLRLPVSRA